MIRLQVRRFTGAKATDLAVAERLARKIHGSQRQGKTVLVDFERVEAAPAFLRVLRAAAPQEKVKFCGLPISQQISEGSPERNNHS